jgi:calcium-dependent protein kinase
MLTGEMPFTGNNTEETINAVKKGALNVKSNSFKQISVEGQKFITALANKNPDKRLTPAEALEHDWMKINSQKTEKPLLLKETLERLKEFRVTNSFGTAVISLVNNHMSEESER